jgi:hypothetical protein
MQEDEKCVRSQCCIRGSSRVMLLTCVETYMLTTGELASCFCRGMNVTCLVLESRAIFIVLPGSLNCVGTPLADIKY